MMRTVLAGLRWWPELLTERERESFGCFFFRERDAEERELNTGDEGNEDLLNFYVNFSLYSLRFFFSFFSYQILCFSSAPCFLLRFLQFSASLSLLCFYFP